jgi:hypothetical protein
MLQGIVIIHNSDYNRKTLVPWNVVFLVRLTVDGSTPV